MTKHHKTPAGAVRRADYPALTAFVQSYLHEEYVQEHGSVGGAALAFSVDASAYERAQVIKEWHLFMAATAGQSIKHIAELLTRELGGAWAPQSRQELDALVSVVDRNA